MYGQGSEVFFQFFVLRNNEYKIVVTLHALKLIGKVNHYEQKLVCQYELCEQQPFLSVSQ